MPSFNLFVTKPISSLCSVELDVVQIIQPRLETFCAESNRATTVSKDLGYLIVRNPFATVSIK